MNSTLTTSDFFKKFLGVSYTNSYIFFGTSLITIIIIILIRIFTKKIWPKKAEKAWNYSLYAAIIFGFIFGISFASLNNFDGLTTEMVGGVKTYVYNSNYEIHSLAKIYSQIFTTLISLIVGPLIFFGLSSKVATYDKSKSVLHSLKYLIIGIVYALIIGILVFQLFRILPHNENPNEADRIASPNYENILKTIVSWLPKNVLASETFSYLAIGILIFALILGFAILLARKADKHDRQVKLTADFLEGGHKIFNVITDLILEVMPIGVFGLFSNAIIQNGGQVFISLGWFILIFLLSLFGLMISQIIYTCAKIKMSPIKYIKYAWKPLTSAFLTQSSNATIPITQKALTENFRVDQTTASSMPVIGSTMGMVACGALYPVMAAGFVYYVDRPFGDVNLVGQIVFGIFLFFSAFFSSFGLSGAPGVASVATRNVFAAVNLPYGATIGSLLAIDPIIDMFRTMTNVNGVIAASLLGEHDDKKQKKQLTNKERTKKNNPRIWFKKKQIDNQITN